MMDQMVEKDLK